MESINSIMGPELTEAVLVWTGWGQSTMPNRSDRRLVDRFGEERAAKLLVLIKRLEDEFYSCDARLIAINLTEMERLVIEQFRIKEPTVSYEIVKALAWCYTFDFK